MPATSREPSVRPPNPSVSAPRNRDATVVNATVPPVNAAARIARIQAWYDIARLDRPDRTSPSQLSSCQLSPRVYLRQNRTAASPAIAVTVG